MPNVTYRGSVFPVASGETVLESLLRQGVDVPNYCRAGACQSCLLRAQAGAVPPVAQQGLKSTLVEQGYFLACLCRPEQDLELESAEGLEVGATIESLERLSATVLRVLVRPLAPFAYRAGQYITLQRADGLARSYSLASLPEESTLELHVRHTPQGRMSGWLSEEARANDRVSIRGPAGECFYTAGKPEQPLLLVGTGTGLAPLAGICRDALRQGHVGPIHLYHGVLRPAGLYLAADLRKLAESHENLQYHPVVLNDAEGASGIRSGALADVIASDHPKLGGWRGFACGDPNVVGLLRKKLFLAGIASREIFADAFVEAPARR